MSEQERRAAFAREYDLLRQTFGFEIVAVVQPLQIGDRVAALPIEDVRPVAGWSPPPPVAQEGADGG